MILGPVKVDLFLTFILAHVEPKLEHGEICKFSQLYKMTITNVSKKSIIYVSNLKIHNGVAGSKP